MALRRIGDWQRVATLVQNIGAEMKHAQMTSLKRWGLKAEGTAKKHISSQDLGWPELKAATIAIKVRKGHSENILVASSSYFQSITSWVDESTMTVYAGVKKTAKGENGEEIADIAATHEFGSKAGSIPARPLWQPTFNETVAWFSSSDSTPAKIFARNIKKYGV